MNFYPHTALEIPRSDSGLIDRGKLNDFWEEAEQTQENLSSAIGCYIFSIKSGRGALPWYVGLAEKQSFKKECFTSHKLVHYNEALVSKKGIPMLTLIAKRTPTGRIVLPTGGEHRDIQFLELQLIDKCLDRNIELCNSSNTKLLKEMVVYGLMNTPRGKSNQDTLDFKKLIGIE